EDEEDRRPPPPGPAVKPITTQRERDEERLCVDAEAVTELLKTDGAMQHVQQKREEHRRGGCGNGDVTTDLTQRREEPYERRRREEKAHSYEMRTEKERRTGDDVRWLQEYRHEMPRQVEERKEPVVEEDVALGEPRVAVVNRRAPPHKVVTDIHDGEGKASRDYSRERTPVAPRASPCAQEGERRGRQRDRQARQGGDADERTDGDRAAAARRDRESARQKEHRRRVRRVPRAAVDAREEERGPECREQRSREGIRARCPVRAQPVVEDARRRAAGD